MEARHKHVRPSRYAARALPLPTYLLLTIPIRVERPTTQRERIRAVKRGDVPRSEVSLEIARLESEVRNLLDKGATPLPETADFERITAWAIDAQQRHWGWS